MVASEPDHDQRLCKGITRPDTGLLPDFIQPHSAQDHRRDQQLPGSSKDRTTATTTTTLAAHPWRIGADALCTGTQRLQRRLRRSLAGPARPPTGSRAQFKSGYHLDGTPLPDSDYFSIFFVAPLGVAAMCDPGLQTWLDDIYAAVIASTDEDYYEESVALLCLLLMTGNFRDPTR